jgi:hypothetical protein
MMPLPPILHRLSQYIARVAQNSLPKKTHKDIVVPNASPQTHYYEIQKVETIGSKEHSEGKDR